MQRHAIEHAPRLDPRAIAQRRSAQAQAQEELNAGVALAWVVLIVTRRALFLGRIVVPEARCNAVRVRAMPALLGRGRLGIDHPAVRMGADQTVRTCVDEGKQRAKGQRDGDPSRVKTPRRVPDRHVRMRSHKGMIQ